MITRERRARIVKEFQRDAKDSGSPEVQIALITERIKNITEHSQRHVKDHNCKRGLLLLVGQRNKLLRYLAHKDEGRYTALIGKLGLRK